MYSNYKHICTQIKKSYVLFVVQISSVFLIVIVDLFYLGHNNEAQKKAT